MIGPDGHIDLSGRWRGVPAVLVASGPSLSLAGVNFIGTLARDGRAKVLAVNDAMYPCAFADVGYACDRRWWVHHRGMPRFLGIRIRMIASPDDRKPHPALAHIVTVGHTGTDGFEARGGFLRSGGHSGYQALNLAIQAGANPIVLVGYDCSDGHFFGSHPEAIRSEADRSLWAPRYAALALAAQERGITVINTAPGSRIKVFPYQPLETTL